VTKINSNIKLNDIASNIRYSDDYQIEYGKSRADINYFDFGLQVNEKIIPHLFKNVYSVCDRLFFNKSDISVFIYPYENIQAECLSIDDKCIVRLASAAVEKLNDFEIRFVIGHELAHHIYNHSHLDASSPELIIISKAREISCDRIGLIACNSYENAISAIVKVQSGLKLVSIDIEEYLNVSIENISKSIFKANYSTHPCLPIRAKSLKNSDTFINKFYPNFSSSEALSEKIRLDDLIKNQLLSLENNYFEELIYKNKHDLFSWIWIFLSLNKNKITKSNSDAISKRFSPKIIKKLKNNFSSMDSNYVESFILEKISEKSLNLINVAPMSYKKFINNEIHNATKIIDNTNIEKQEKIIRLKIHSQS